MAGRKLAVGDVNGDGFLDLVVESSETVVLPGAGDGSFGPAHVVAGAGSTPHLVDLNQDGALDLVTLAPTGEPAIRVLLGHGDGTFGEAAVFTVGGPIPALAVGHLDGDGQIDIAVPSTNLGQVSVLFGNGDGTFGASGFATIDRPRSIAFGRLDGDGALDLVVASYSMFAVHAGRRDGGFDAPVGRPLDDGWHAVAVGDFDEDGADDVAVMRQSANSVSVFANDGAGNLTSRLDLGTGGYPYHIVTGDVDVDGHLDLVVANTASHSVSAFLGRGDGTFVRTLDSRAGMGAAWIAVGRIDGDALPDLAVANRDAHSVSLLRGRGDGTFAGIAEIQVPGQLSSTALGDLNADGQLDLAVAGWWFDGFVGVGLGHGDGTFGEIAVIPLRGQPRSIAIRDLDLDGFTDIVAANPGAYGVSILLGDGSGAFPERLQLGAGYDVQAIEIADLNADGRPDVAAVGSWSGRATAFLSRGAPTPIYLDALTATPIQRGVLLTWQLSEDAIREVAWVRVQRSWDEPGPYSEVTPVPLTSQSRMFFEDTSVDPSAGHWYRLAFERRAGGEWISPAVHIQAGGRSPTVLHVPSLSDGDGVEIRYHVASRADVQLGILDVRGRSIRRLSGGVRHAGDHVQFWDLHDESGRRVARGMYFVRLAADDVALSRRLLVLR